MTGPEFYAIRQRLDMTADAFGRALGYAGNRNSLQARISDMEAGRRTITPQVARLALMYGRHGVPEEMRGGHEDR
jgi:hypothetical protein